MAVQISQKFHLTLERERETEKEDWKRHPPADC